MTKFIAVKILGGVLCILAFFCQKGSAEELIQVKTAIHISSTVSDGEYSISEIVEIAKENGVEIIILSDRDFMRWEYGFWPLRNIVKKTVETNSVYTHGIKQYLGDIDKVQKENPDLVIIPGIESAPFYYWEGSPFKDNLKMYNWHKHMLVIGLENHRDYEYLPVISNRKGLYFKFRIWMIWPVITLLIGFFFLRPDALKRQVFGVIMIIFSLLFLFNNFPFFESKYDQYHGEKNTLPYQNLIDYVNDKYGLIFWAHPEAENVKKIGNISTETREYTEDLLGTCNYTGFSVFYEGYKKVGCPGGIWDEVLKQYCQGTRKHPCWAIAGLNFDQRGDLSKRMKNLSTMLLIPHLTKEASLKALKEGRVYVVRGKERLVLDEFVIQDGLLDIKGTIGDEINLKGYPIIKIRGHFENKSSLGAIKINLIKNGNIIKTFEVTSPFEIVYVDNDYRSGKKVYYRLEINYPGGALIANPIFLV